MEEKDKNSIELMIGNKFFANEEFSGDFCSRENWRKRQNKTRSMTDAFENAL